MCNTTGSSQLVHNFPKASHSFLSLRRSDMIKPFEPIHRVGYPIVWGFSEGSNLADVATEVCVRGQYSQIDIHHLLNSYCGTQSRTHVP